MAANPNLDKITKRVEDMLSQNRGTGITNPRVLAILNFLVSAQRKIQNNPSAYNLPRLQALLVRVKEEMDKAESDD